MTSTTTNSVKDYASFAYRLTQLVEEVDNHPHREELLKLVESQLQDDASAVC